MQEREATSHTRVITKHTDDSHFIVNMNALHNSKTIATALPPDLRKPSFQIDDVTTLRKNASAQVRDKKRQQAAERKEILMAKATNRAHAPTLNESTGATELVVTLTTDNDLFDVLEDVFVGHEDHSVNEVEAAVGESESVVTGNVSEEASHPVDSSSLGNTAVPIFDAIGQQRSKNVTLYVLAISIQISSYINHLFQQGTGLQGRTEILLSESKSVSNWQQTSSIGTAGSTLSKVSYLTCIWVYV